MSVRELLYFELDCPKCPHVYGTSPCTASGTLAEACRNTPATCQDLANYSATTQTIRWVKSTDYVPATPYAVPSLVDVSCSPQRINPGENLGTRERVTATFFNHPHNDNDLDPYVEHRTYNPYERGTYWGKFAAMYPNIQGYPARVARGTDDMDYADFEVSHYIASVGKLAGDKKGYSIAAKDVLDFAEGNKTLLPPPSEGLLASAITAASGSVTLTPAGIGDEKYPATFNASIGDENVQCTRVGDVVTFTQRGFLYTQPDDHDEGDTLQLMESFIAQNASQVLNRLLLATPTPAEYFNNSQWDQQVAIVTSPNLTAYIAEPTEVFKLIQDLMRDLALDIHTDVIGKKVIMEFLVGKTPTLTLTDGSEPGDVAFDNPSIRFYEDKRCDLFFMSFGRRNPLEKMDEGKNYPATIIRPSSNAVNLISGNPPAIRRHYSRWISSFLRAQASKTAQFIVGRYEIAPRGLSCTVKSTSAPRLGRVVNVKTSVFEDFINGVPSTPTIQMQVVAVKKGQGNYDLELEEFRASGFIPEEQTIIISLSENLLDMGGAANLREIYNNIYPGVIPTDSIIRFEADAGVVFGSFSNAYSVIMGDWPEVGTDNVTLQIVDLFIAGRGGSGGIPGFAGGNGSGAFYTRVAVELIDCTVGAGGGGGGGSDYGGHPARGGGGAGSLPGSGYESGTLTTGGIGEDDEPYTSGGNGGDLGQDGGVSATGELGGSAGAAIDGDSYVTITGTTTIYGPRIN